MQGAVLDAIENEKLTEDTDDNDQYKTMAALYDSVYHYVNVPQPIEEGASCFNENSTAYSEELRRPTLSPQT